MKVPASILPGGSSGMKSSRKVGSARQQLVASPQESHVRREDLVARAHEVVAVERLHVDQAMRPVVHRVQEDLAAHRVRAGPPRRAHRRWSRARWRRACTRPAACATTTAAAGPRRAGGRRRACSTRGTSRRIFSSASQVAMLASWSRSVTMISSRCASVWPMARLTRRMNEVAFMPKAISSGRCALTKAATLSRARGDRRIDRDALRVAARRAARCDRCRWWFTASSTLCGHLRAGGVVEEDEVAGLLQRGETACAAPRQERLPVLAIAASSTLRVPVSVRRSDY